VAEEQQDARRGELSRPATRLDILAVVPALAAVVGGAYGMVAAAQSLGDRFDVSDIVLGALVLAALTSIPNLIAAVRLARHGRGAACVSEALNSNNANILVGLCVPAVILGFGSASGLEIFASLWMVGMTVVAVALAFGGGLTRREGAVRRLRCSRRYGGLAAVALDADLVTTLAHDRPAGTIEWERPLNGRQALPGVGAAIAHHGETHCHRGDPHDLLADDCPGCHQAARSANFA
jgi:hypothetical protein